MAEFLDKQMKVGIKLETGAWDTAPVTTAANYAGVNAIPGSIVINPATQTSNLNYTSAAGVYEETSRKLVTNAGVIPSIEFECYATPLVTQFLMRMALHTTTGTDVLAIYPTNDIIDFPADEGEIGSVIVWSQAGDGVSLKNAVVDTITLSMSNVGSGEARLARLKVRLVGTRMATGLTITGATSVETIANVANSAETVNDDFTLALAVTGTGFSSADLCWRRYELTIANNIITDCIDAHEPANWRRTSPTIEHTIDIPHNDATVGFITYFKSGDPVTFSIENGVSQLVTGYWLFQNAGDTYITKPPSATEGSMQSNSLTIREMFDGTSWDALVTISQY